MPSAPTDTPTDVLTRRPLTWAEFINEASGGGEIPLCKCGKPTCMVSFNPRCSCGGLLSFGVHVNAPTLIVGCMRCGRSPVYLALQAT